MIKILPSGTTVKIAYGLMPLRKKNIKGRLGEGAREHNFITPVGDLKATWRDHGIDAVLCVEESVYVRNISMVFNYHSPKHNRDTAIWTDVTDISQHGGTLTTKTKRQGSGSFWLSEGIDAEGILFRQSPPAEYPVSFKCHPGIATLEICWSIERSLEVGENLPLPTVRLSKGERERLVNTWRREWRNSSNHIPSPDRRVGWKDDGQVNSADTLKEIMQAIRSEKIPVSWFALGPDYALATGDWLETTETFRDKMGNISRLISEQNTIPGLRFAPFLVSRKSAFAASHKDWMVRSTNGNPVQVKSYNGDKDASWVLDISNVKVRNHIKRILTVMRDQWGFRVFILERMDDIVTPGTRMDGTHGPGHWYELAGSLIREALGKKVYILSSGIPLQAIPGEWDARKVSSEVKEGNSRKAECSKLATASDLLHRAYWSEGSWANASCDLNMEMFKPGRSIATSTLLNAAAISTGLTVFTGDPRGQKSETIDAIKTYLELFEESRKGALRISANVGGGGKIPLIVRNDIGRIGLFNLSRYKKEVMLDREGLRSALGVSSSLSAGEGAVFNSPEIHVALPPRGNRLFRG